MAKQSQSGVLPGVISVPATKANAAAPKPNGTAMPAGQINPYVSAPVKGKK